MTEHNIYECLLCGTRFEAGVADADEDRPRCPQCFMSVNRPVDAGDHAQPVIRELNLKRGGRPRGSDHEI